MHSIIDGIRAFSFQVLHYDFTVCTLICRNHSFWHSNDDVSNIMSYTEYLIPTCSIPVLFF